MMRPACILLLAVVACSHSPAQIETHDSSLSFFGLATLKEDNAICLTMRSEESGHPAAESHSCYGPEHPQYEKIRQHVGQISVGEETRLGPFE